MVAVGFNPRIRTTNERFVAERRLNVWCGSTHEMGRSHDVVSIVAPRRNDLARLPTVG